MGYQARQVEDLAVDETAGGVGWGVTGVCITEGMAPTPCRRGEMGCTTEYGVSVDTVCAETRMGGTVCVEFCDIDPTACPTDFICRPTDTGGGGCFPAS